jgi:diketogulonate reductase-like aldo/keto reductase
MASPENVRAIKLPLNNGRGEIPVVGFGTLMFKDQDTKNVIKSALEAGFQHFDCAERYGNEKEVGDALREVFAEGKIQRKDVFITTKLWNNNHRPERVAKAFEASLARLQLDYIDLYLMHTPYAYKTGDDQDPRDERGEVIYDEGITIFDTWRAMERLVDMGKCKAIGISDIGLEELDKIFDFARIKPAIIQTEVNASFPQWELLDYCTRHGMIMQAFAPLGHNIKSKLIDDSLILKIAMETNKTPIQVLVAWAIQSGMSILTQSKSTDRIKENLEFTMLPQKTIFEINDKIKTEQHHIKS